MRYPVTAVSRFTPLSASHLTRSIQKIETIHHPGPIAQSTLRSRIDGSRRRSGTMNRAIDPLESSADRGRLPGSGSVNFAGSGSVDLAGSGSVDLAGSRSVDLAGSRSLNFAESGSVDLAGSRSVDLAGSRSLNFAESGCLDLAGSGSVNTRKSTIVPVSIGDGSSYQDLTRTVRW